jgi:hypothetical protein
VLDIEVHRPPVRHSLKVEKLTAWLGRSNSPTDTAVKQQLRDYLEARGR